MHIRLLKGALALGCAAFISAKGDPLSDAQVRQAVIANSIAAYQGNCPCPYNTDRRGYTCGRRSAYNRPGGYSPKCYQKDVSHGEVAAYRQEHGRRPIVHPRQGSGLSRDRRADH